MCGFVGIINNKQIVNSNLLSKMAAVLNHRGPDEEGYLIEGKVGFYHKRLSIIDLLSGRQPMTSGPFSIVFNGEIYNYIELRDSLKKLGYTFRTTSDTEVILKLYEQYGVESISMLNGMFSFLLFDRKNNKVIAARDPMGIKPLYYFKNEEMIICASEIKAILQHPNIKAEPSLESIEEYLTFQYVLGKETLFKGIKKLLPGHYQIIDMQSMQIQTHKYWEPCFKIDTHHTEEYFIFHLRNLLENTIEIQLRSDVPLGSYLSGGMDSSLVALLAASKYNGKFQTFTGAFRNGPHFNEVRYAKEVAKQCNAEMFVIYPTEYDFIDLLPKLIYYMDEPTAGPGIFPQFMVSRLASQKVKVVLGGQGGDEIFGGYARYVVAYLEQALKGAIFETTEEGEHIVSLKSIISNLTYLKKYTPMLIRFWEKGTFEPMDRRYFRLIERNDGDLSKFSGDFCAKYNIERVFTKFQKIFNHPDTLSYYNKMIHYDITVNLPALLHVEDRVSMANSLESRVPLIDHRIVELIARMPPAMKFKGAEMKYILKKTVKDILPKKIFERKDKMGFPVPLHMWAKNKAKDFFRDILLTSSCRERGIYNSVKIESLIENEYAFSRRLWGLINLELWYQTFIDRN